MKGEVLRAREWVLTNQAAILQALAPEHESEVRGRILVTVDRGALSSLPSAQT
jgi:hypothetical protein